MLGLALALGACGGSDTPVGEVGAVEGFLGGVATDEPRAALIGRETLSAGGTAADAAVAMYFALSVTLPDSAGIGGGGVCLVHDNAAERTETLEFLPRAAAGGTVSVPLNLRAMFALHAKYGRLNWGQLVAPAENLARFGERVSRAFARRLAMDEARRLAEDPESRRIFIGADGKLPAEGTLFRQLDLAALLTQVRTRGPGDFYVGGLARKVAAGSAGALSVADLNGAVPRWSGTLALPLGNRTLHLAPGPAGVLQAQVWRLIADDDAYEDAPAAGRDAVLAAALGRAFDRRGEWLETDGTLRVSPTALIDDDWIARLRASATGAAAETAARGGGASLVAIDREGSAAACLFTMTAPFGTGRTIPGTGVLLAPAPDAASGDLPMPVLVVNANVNEVFFAAAASGGPAGIAALLDGSARALIAETSLAQTLAAPRAGGGEGGRVNAAHCPGGLPVAPETCAVGTDPRGLGLSASADQ